MLDFFQTYSKETFAVVSVIVGFLLNRIFRLKPKLIYSVRHSSSYPVAQPLLDAEGQVVMPVQVVRTASIFSENVGLQPATNVEFTFNWKPPIYTVYPGRAFNTADTEMGRWSIKLDSLAPGEVFAIEILSINQELPLISSMRCDEAAGKVITMIPQRQFPAWFNHSALAFFVLGVGAAIYLITLLIEWIARQP